MKIEVIEKGDKTKYFVKIAFDPKIPESRFVIGKDGEETLFVKSPEKKDINRRKFILLARQAIQEAKKHRLKKIAVDFSDLNIQTVSKKMEEISEITAVNFEMANYEFVKYKTPPKEGFNFVEHIGIIAEKKDIRVVGKGLAKGQTIGREINDCRSLTNMPGGDMTPQVLVEDIRKIVKDLPIKMKVIEEKEMQKLGMGAILGVSRGSAEKPKFVILEYQSGKKEKPIVLVGKAITFDSGGLDVKPFPYMTEMHMDMSGGAAVAYSIVLAAKLGIKKNIVGLIPIAENMPSGESFRPGDILKTMSGKTIEIGNTDAEGRLILADALSYAEKFNPRIVFDIATLTGAAEVALGERASAIFSKDEKLVSAVREMGEESGDYVWPLPLWEEYSSDIKGNYADINNLRSKGDWRYGGAIHGAAFLAEFAEKLPKWMHLDIVPRMTAVHDEFLARGAAGTPVRLLVKILERL